VSVIDTSGALAAAPARSGSWEKLIGISETRNWANPPWVVFDHNRHSVVEIDWFFASDGGLKFYSRQATAQVARRIYERYANNREAESWLDVPHDGESGAAFLNGTTQTRGQLPYSYFLSGHIRLEHHDSGRWHGTIELFTQSIYHRGSITTGTGCTGFVPASTNTALAYGNLTAKAWVP
jgi:hypothetical protein